ncbi:hypothetical protein Scep_021734 [Stephania cephalantha]|uniref:Uncharacterized protein n=1 Tax=Stephania cephalantha TaxID=152367 RepID=A0AAP0F3Z5_9MAGN
MHTNTSETPPTVNELYLHLHTVNHDGVTFIDTRSERFYAKLQRRRLELTQATPDHPVDDEALYLNVAGECPKGRVYGLGSLGRKKRRYADHGASTSQMPEMVPRAEFDIVAEQLRKVMTFMHQQFRMTMDGAGLSRPQPPPPPPHDQQQSPQIDPADPPQQQDNVEREMQDWLTRYEQLAAPPPFILLTPLLTAAAEWLVVNVAGVYEGVVHLEELNILLSRSRLSILGAMASSERVDRVGQTKEYWESQCRAFMGV